MYVEENYKDRNFEDSLEEEKKKKETVHYSQRSELKSTLFFFRRTVFLFGKTARALGIRFRGGRCTDSEGFHLLLNRIHERKVLLR